MSNKVMWWLVWVCGFVNAVLLAADTHIVVLRPLAPLHFLWMVYCAFVLLYLEWVDRNRPKPS